MKNHPAAKLPVFCVEPPEPGKRSGGFGLPSYLQEKACKRLAQFALLMTVLVAIVSLISQAVWTKNTSEDLLLLRSMQVLTFLLSAGLFLIARSRRLHHSTILKLGLAYEVLFCLVVSVGYNWFTGSAYGIFASITFASLVIAVYPLIVPSPPKHTLVTALLSAASAPLSVFIVSSMEIAKSDLSDYLGVSIYPAMCVVLALFGSRIVYGLNTEVAEALELGSYHLISWLGRGGMGEVWRAKHRLLARPAAIKLVRLKTIGDNTSHTQSLMLQRFEREAQVTASLKSPHTVDLYDFGRTNDGSFYYAMELLDGIDLETLVEKYGPQPPERTVSILIQVCKSLAEAHDAGLVHRDIKPANILLCRYGRDLDFVKVLDFGLVALEPDDQKAKDIRLTTDGFAGGTPAYMPPEMASGGQVDGRTDIYAMGCVAFWLLTGRTIFAARTPMAAILAHVKETPELPSKYSENDIPEVLDRIVMSCAEKNPDKRPQDADELMTRLEACPLEKPWTPKRASKWWETHKPKTAMEASNT